MAQEDGHHPRAEPPYNLSQERRSHAEVRGKTRQTGSHHDRQWYKLRGRQERTSRVLQTPLHTRYARCSRQAHDQQPNTMVSLPSAFPTLRWHVGGWSETNESPAVQAPRNTMTHQRGDVYDTDRGGGHTKLSATHTT